MTAALRIRDASGNITFDFSDRFARIIGEKTVNTSAGSVTVDSSYGGNIWYQYHPNSGSVYAPAFSVNGNVISWVFNSTFSGTLPDGILIYGRY